MNKLFTILFVLFLPLISYSQLYQGPSTGLVQSGATVSTDNFMANAPGNKLPSYLMRPLRNKIPIKPYPDILNKVLPTAPQGSNYFIDPNVNINNPNPDADPFIIRGFQALLDPGNYIPPDFYCAVGPTHVIGVDNGRFRIWDKTGKLIKTIDADSWFGTTLSGPGAFDPKVSYDHFAKRWVMVWLDQRDAPQRGNFLISVSDDSIPLGIWHNWALPSNYNGSTFDDSWGDYQGVGFDDLALYITSNQFQFTGGFEGSKIRIVKKSELYTSNGGQLSYTDFWDIREPSNPNNRTFGVRPAIFYTPNTSGFYLVCKPPYYPSNTSMVLYKITNSVTNPVMTGTNVPMTAYASPPGAGQLGGSNPTIESGGDDLRNEPIYRDGFIWGVHQIKSGTNGAYSSIRYFKINTQAGTTVEDAAMGADGYWLFYPSINVDKDLNTAVTFSRSGETEYIGAFYTSRLNSDPPNYLSGSRLLQAGKANYNKTFGSGRNRWGDYNGIWLDPSDQNNFWMLTEYAESPGNTWAGWMSNVRLIPFNGARINNSKDTLNFGIIEQGFSSDTIRLIVSNMGSDTLFINSISIQNFQFSLLNTLTYPIKIGFNQSKELYFKYYPAYAANILDSLKIISNDNNNNSKKIILKAKGYRINPVPYDSVYAISGSQSNGSFLSINNTSGSASLIGLSGFTDITGISLKPDDLIIYGCIPGSDYTNLIRINSYSGDAYFTKKIPVGNLRSIAFDSSYIIFGASQNGNLYKYNLLTNDSSFISNTGIANLYSIAINPINGQMWGVSLSNKIYRINKLNGNAVQAGVPGFPLTPSIAFNSKGELYGLTGLGVQVSNLVKYDTATGIAVLIGSSGYQALTSLVFAPVYTAPAPGPAATYNLYQNYPNPFNAGTTFRFDVPSASDLNLTVFDVLGRKVSILFNKRFQPGVYEFKWDAPNLPSGIYFYRLQTNSFSAIKKFAIIK